jgi:lipopolysaccharide/colanic/teichoic acid biosynthesis glycosyltransferase
MNSAFDDLVPALQAPASALKRDRVTLASDLLPLADIACLLVAATLATTLTLRWWLPVGMQLGFANDIAPAGWVAAALAPFMLYDPRFGAAALRARGLRPMAAHVLRFAMFAAAVLALGAVSDATDGVPRAGLMLWLSIGLIGTLLVRSLLTARLQRQRREGRLTDVSLAPGAGAPARLGAALLGDGVTVMLLADRPIRRWGAVAKSGEDLLLGSVLTVLLLPLLALVAMAVRLDSPGPILYRQRRHGLNNDEFDIYKFRTMRWDPSAHGGVLHQTARSDDRITRVGHFLRTWSLDELPQLMNVLQGTMSLVGPRPHAIQMRTQDRLGCEITPEYAHRHRVKPGITGWAQVNGARGATATTDQLQRRVVLDLHYVENWSLLLDLKILALTWRAVLQRTNAF